MEKFPLYILLDSLGIYLRLLLVRKPKFAGQNNKRVRLYLEGTFGEIDEQVKKADMEKQLFEYEQN